MLELLSCEMYDSYYLAPFQIKVNVPLYILDYPGIDEVLKVTMNNLSSQNSINALECQSYNSRVLAGSLALQNPMEIPKTRLYPYKKN